MQQQRVLAKLVHSSSPPCSLTLLLLHCCSISAYQQKHPGSSWSQLVLLSELLQFDIQSRAVGFHQLWNCFLRGYNLAIRVNASCPHMLMIAAHDSCNTCSFDAWGLWEMSGSWAYQQQHAGSNAPQTCVTFCVAQPWRCKMLSKHLLFTCPKQLQQSNHWDMTCAWLQQLSFSVRTSWP